MRSECPGVGLVAVMLCAAAAPTIAGQGARPPAAPAHRVAREILRAPIAERVLDLAFIDDERLILLTGTAVALYERSGDALALRDRRALEASMAVRAPAGVIAASAGEAAFWVTTNLAEGAVLFTIDGGRLQEIEHAAALPWPGGAQGARFRPDSNLIDVVLPGLGSGPHLRVGAGDAAWAIAPDGLFGVAPSGWTDTRVGSAAARLWSDAWIASSPEPPGASDRLLLVHAGGGTAAIVATFPVEGSVTALGARARGRRALVAAALASGGAHRLVLLEVARDE